MASLVGPGWTLRDIRAVLFDKDGTLVDSHCYWGAIIERRAGALAGRLARPALAPGLRRAMGFSVETGRLSPEGPIALVSREKVISAVVGELQSQGLMLEPAEVGAVFEQVHARFMDELADHLRLLPGVVELLLALRAAGVKTAVVTTDARANTDLSLSLLGLTDSFDLVVARESSPEAKETGVPARLALRALEIDPEHAVCVGDAPMDALMAAHSGTAAIAVSTGQVPQAMLRQYTPRVLSSLAELRVRPDA